MRLKAILLSAFALISLSASAQDKIYKKNGDVIDGKVKEVNQRSISYKRSDNADGPDYVINRNEVDRIKYQNGTEDYMSGDRRNDDREPMRKAQPKVNYGNNTISLALINLSETGYGLGIAYEVLLDKKGMIGLYLPVNVCLGGLGSNNVYDPLTGGYSNTAQRRTVYQFMPGAKFYPTGNRGKVRYGVGPQLVYETGTIEREQYVYDPTFPSGFYTIGDAKVQKLGVMINNSVNMYPTSHVFIGIDLGLGLPYSNKEESLSTGLMEEKGTDAPLVQFNFRLGFRF